jgi:UTP:GlnB (protein PII) uridylyltransferase
MTTKQKVERMRHLLSTGEFMPEFDKIVKNDAMDLIEKHQDTVKELSLRTLIQVTKIRQSAGKNWSDLAEYAICG